MRARQVAILLAGITMVAGSEWAHSGPSTHVKRAVVSADCPVQLKTPAQVEAEISAAWDLSREGFKILKSQVGGMDSAIQAMATAMYTSNHAILMGAPGGAKTFLAKKVAEAWMRYELSQVGEKEKRLFILQFHKLLMENVITGTPKIKKILKDGVMDIETADALVAEDVILALLDEVEKANPAVLSALLSVMNERKAFLGDRVVTSFLRSSFLTSNKNVSEFLDSFEEDRTAGEALLDRILVKHIMPNQIIEDTPDNTLLARWETFKSKAKMQEKTAFLGLKHLDSLMKKIEIPDETLRAMAKLVSEIDAVLTAKSDAIMKSVRYGERVEPYIQATQFSNRSIRMLYELMKGSFIVEQLMNDVPYQSLRLKMEKEDLIHLAAGAVYGGPGGFRKVVDPAGHVVYSDDGVIQNYINSTTISASERANLKMVEDERTVFLQQLNAILAETTDSAVEGKASEAGLAFKKRASKVSEDSGSGNPLERSWIQSQKAHQEIEQKIYGVDHYIKALELGVLAKTHVFALGPAGGAKTAGANIVLNSVLNSVKKINPEKKLFFLQVNKMTPEGRVSGFPKVDEQMKTGRIEIVTTSSLVDGKNEFAVIDEAEKGPPSFFNQLLSVFNERKAFLGRTEIQSNLKSAVMTSNKTPAELEELFSRDGDRSAMRALLDRAINKVYIQNKFVNDADVMAYFRAIEKGFDTSLPDFPLSDLRPLTEKIVVQDSIGILLTEIHEQFIARRRSVLERSQALYQESPVENPFLYKPAATESTRTLFALLDQIKSSVILDRMHEGVSFAEATTPMTFKEIRLFSQGLVYWGPYEIVATEKDGVVQFTVEGQLDELILSPRVNERQRFMLETIRDEVNDFVTIANDRLYQFTMAVREQVAKYPHLFPGLIIDANKFKASQSGTR